jgi:hypothetical protein
MQCESRRESRSASRCQTTPSLEAHFARLCEGYAVHRSHLSCQKNVCKRRQRNARRSCFAKIPRTDILPVSFSDCFFISRFKQSLYSLCWPCVLHCSSYVLRVRNPPVARATALYCIEDIKVIKYITVPSACGFYDVP